MAKVVLYHADCNDGLMAAAVISYFEKDPTITYLPVYYKMPLPDFPTNCDVILADFCHNELGTMLELLDKCRTLTVIDHHVDALPILNELSKLESSKLHIVFESDESGASTAWHHYSERPLPKVVKLVKNHDLHVRKTIEDDYFHYGVLTQNQTITFWTSLIEDETQVLGLISAGRHIYNFIQNTVIPQVSTKTRYASVCGFTVPVVNVNRILQGLVLESMCNVSTVAIAYEDLADGKRKWSVRSSEKTAPGAAKRIANKFGGGGHHNAAGFLTDTSFMLPFLDM